MGFKRTALVVAITAVVLNILPSYFTPSLPKISDGFAAPGWEKVEQIFKSQVESGLEKGGGFAVWYKGELVFDYVGGYADDQAERPYKRDTLSSIFSSTKGVSAITTALLVERGLLDYDTPVVKYWPEFGQNGKEKITVRTLLAHAAGLAVIDTPFHIKDIENKPEKVSKALAEQKPAWQPGTAIGYHAYSIALYMNELVKRVDPKHRTLSQFFRDEIATPFDIDIYIGLPLEKCHRSSRVYSASLWSVIECRNWDFLPLIVQYTFGISVTEVMKLFENPTGLRGENMNDPELRTIPCGSTHGHAAASALAKIYGIIANGGSYKGKKLFSDKTIRDMTKPVLNSKDVYLGFNATFAAGLNIVPNPQGEPTFGTAGAGGQHGVGDLKHHMGWAYVSNHMKNSRPYDDPRFNVLRDTVYEIIAQQERNQ